LLIECSSDVIFLDDDESVPQKPALVNQFTADEDGELILLVEKLGPPLPWRQIAHRYNTKFPRSPRTWNSLKSRYCSALRSGGLQVKPDMRKQRDRAITSLRKRGIELEVHDSISEVDSEDEDHENDYADDDDKGTEREGDGAG
jgi:hypothetical protein